MLTLILAEAELERVPKELRGHRQVEAAARRAGKMATRCLLDSSQHHAAMRTMHDGRRRGRPDLVHLFLLTALESRVNKEGRMRVIIHTRNDERIDIDPETRLIRNYPRFCGLMEQLFESGSVPAETPLLRLTKRAPLVPLISSLRADRVIWLDEAAPAIHPKQLFANADPEDHVACVVGGFPHGSYRNEPPPGVERFGFGPDALSVWTIAAELTVRYSDAVEGD